MENLENKEEKSMDMAETVNIQNLPESKKFQNTKLFSLGILGALVVLFFGFYGFIFWQVKGLSVHPFVVKSAHLLHVPAVKVDGKTLLYSDYRNDLTSLKNLSNNPAFSFGATSEQELSDLVVANFLSQVKTEELAKKYNITMSNEELEAKKAELFSQYGEESVKQNIQQSYGWDFDMFVEKILQPSLLNEKVREGFAASVDANQFTQEEASLKHILFKVENPEDAKEKSAKKIQADSVLMRLKRGEDFAKLATEFSGDDGSKESGGDLGWLPKGATVEPFNTLAFSIELKKLSDVIETSYGYHILFVNERRTVPNFDAFMESEVKKMQPKFYVNIHNPLEVANAPVDQAPPVSP